MFKRSRGFRTAQDGVVAIEMAFIFPVMLVLFFGLLDLTGYISNSRKVTSIAGSIADLVGQNRNFIDNEITIPDYYKVAGLIMKPQSDADISIRISAFRPTLVSGVTKPVRIWRVTKGASPDCTGEPLPADLLNLMSEDNDVIVAEACTKYKPLTGNIMTYRVIGDAEIPIKQTIMLRPRSSKKLECYQSRSTTTGVSTCPGKE